MIYADGNAYVHLTYNSRKEHMWMTRPMDLECTISQMVQSMKGNGWMIYRYLIAFNKAWKR